MRTKLCLIAICTALLSLLFVMCMEDTKKSDETISSRSYSGHESDADANNFVRAYPSKVASRLDDCQTCHSGGTVSLWKKNSDGSFALNGSGNKIPDSPKSISNTCSYCHLHQFDAPGNYASGFPNTFADTLNPYGLAYKNAGRNVGAIKNIGTLDSDGDSYSNDIEIAALRYPGSEKSNPGLLLAPTIVLTWEDVMAMPSHTQFMILNAQKQQFDTYVTFKGVTLQTLMSSKGIDLNGATGMTFMAPDGFTADYVYSNKGFNEIDGPYPKGTFYDLRSLQASWTDSSQGLIEYPDNIYNLNSGDPMPHDVFAMIVYESNGQNLIMSSYDKISGKIIGEGPYRIIRPQSAATRPDRGSSAIKYGDGYDYSNSFDHNAGDCVKGTCIIRIDPMPAGYEEYFSSNGWSLIQEKKIVIYGYGIN